MSDTYSRCIIQIVFAVKFRKRQIQPKWKDQLHALIAGLINRRYHRCLIVNSVCDHIHILVSLGPQQAISDLVRDIKRASSSWINNFPDYDVRTLGKFRWQEGFSVFTYHCCQKDTIYRYILNQEIHHGESSLKDEFLDLVKEHELDVDPRYAGEWMIEVDHQHEMASSSSGE